MTDATVILAGGMAAVFLGSLVQGTAGLGFALVSVPIMIFFYHPQTAIPILLIMGTFVNSLVLYESRKWVRIRRMVPFMIFGLLGTPIGTYLLIMMDVNTFKVFIGTVIFFVALLLFIGFQKKITHERLAVVPIGLTSGLLQGSLTMCGPPVIFFMMNQGVQKQEFRANLVAFIMVMNTGALINYYVGGLLTREVLTYSAGFIPAVAIGGVCGILLARRINEAVFRRIALAIVAFGGVSSALSGLGLW